MKCSTHMKINYYPHGKQRITLWPVGLSNLRCLSTLKPVSPDRISHSLSESLEEESEEEEEEEEAKVEEEREVAVRFGIARGKVDQVPVSCNYICILLPSYF